jgi:hypothetical protein
MELSDALNQECIRIVDVMMNSPMSGIFSKPIDPVADKCPICMAVLIGDFSTDVALIGKVEFIPNQDIQRSPMARVAEEGRKTPAALAVFPSQKDQKPG